MRNTNSKRDDILIGKVNKNERDIIKEEEEEGPTIIGEAIVYNEEESKYKQNYD